MSVQLPEGRTGRSVNDFHTRDALRSALKNPNQGLSPYPPTSWNLGELDPASEAELEYQVKALQLNKEYKNPDSRDWKLEDYDKATSHPPMLEMELSRLAVLKSYRMFDFTSSIDPTYDRLLDLLCRLFDVPIAHISIVDLGRLCFLAERGLSGLKELPRNKTVCAHAIINKMDMVIVSDLTQDSRFKDMPLVTQPPHARFYASAPLVCPEGFRLGTVAIQDTKPRSADLTLEEKQNFREIADLIMGIIIENREIRNHEFRNPSHLIACTANDLLTPLKGVVNGLSNIRNDEELMNSLSDQPKEFFRNASTCSSVMTRICRKTLHTYEGKQQQMSRVNSYESFTSFSKQRSTAFHVGDFITHLRTLMGPLPKQVPLVMTSDPKIPPFLVRDELKILRSVVNLLTNACANTQQGSIHLTVFIRAGDSDDDSFDKGFSTDDGGDDLDDEFSNTTQSVVFQVEDTGSGIPVEKYPNLFQPVMEEQDSSSCTNTLLQVPSKEYQQSAGLGLFSVAAQMSSIGGKYGFRPREFDDRGKLCFDDSDGAPLTGSVFWISVPLVIDEQAEDTLETF